MCHKPIRMIELAWSWRRKLDWLHGHTHAMLSLIGLCDIERLSLLVSSVITVLSDCILSPIIGTWENANCRAQMFAFSNLLMLDLSGPILSTTCHRCIHFPWESLPTAMFPHFPLVLSIDTNRTISLTQPQSSATLVTMLSLCTNTCGWKFGRNKFKGSVLSPVLLFCLVAIARRKIRAVWFLCAI